MAAVYHDNQNPPEDREKTSKLHPRTWTIVVRYAARREDKRRTIASGRCYELSLRG